MALQGSLQDFSATEILQMLGMQQKTGCLLLENGNERVQIHVHDGRIVSTRSPGMATDDPLLQFLVEIHRLTEEQLLGIAALHKSSGRDLEDILANGRYLEPDELAGYLERLMLEQVARVVRWDRGTYRFEADRRWTLPVHLRLGVEPTLIESMRRADEESRRGNRFADREALLGVRDLPDPDEPLAEEERELFGIIDGRHTLAEIVAEARLTESETLEALDRMLQANWIEFTGRAAALPASPAAPPARRVPVDSSARHLVRHAFALEMLLAIGIMVAAIGLGQGANLLRAQLEVHADDVFLAAQIRDVRFALELYRREHGGYPPRLDALVADRWIRPNQLEVPGHHLYYHLSGTPQSYDLTLERKR